MPTVRKFYFLPFLFLIALFPFFEGGETSNGLFIIHAIILLSLAAAIFTYSRVVISKTLTTYLPFLFILLISAAFSDYKFAGFLKLWDYVIAGAWALLVSTLIYHHENEFNGSAWLIFLFGAVSVIAAILFYNTREIMRISASFLNPNDYASYALMLLCFGLFCVDRQFERQRKTLLITILVLLLLSLALSFSRGIFVAILALIAVVFLRHRPSKAVIAMLCALVLLSGIFIALRFRMYEDPLRYYRLKIWKSSLSGLTDSPYMGVGLGMLEYRSNRFNFPADTEVARYGKIARSADNQYVQILAETGFLGFFAFLFWWIGTAAQIRKLSSPFFYVGLPWLILTVTGLFSLPLQNTSVLLLFFLLIVYGETLDSKKNVIVLEFGSPARIVSAVVCAVLFIFCVYFPYAADREFHLATSSRNAVEMNEHLTKAVRYNPYQPYYPFYYIRPIVDHKPELSEKKWASILSVLDEAIALNPQEYEFYLYKARVLKILLNSKRTLQFYSGAVSSYQTALDCNPYNVFLRLEFASFLAQFGRYDLAEAEARKSLEFEPAFLNARLFIAEVLFRLNRTEEGKKEYQQFQRDAARLQSRFAVAPSPYIRELLTINQKQKQRLDELSKHS